jgi:hypothetical protein
MEAGAGIDLEMAAVELDELFGSPARANAARTCAIGIRASLTAAWIRSGLGAIRSITPAGLYSASRATLSRSVRFSQVGASLAPLSLNQA